MQRGGTLNGPCLTRSLAIWRTGLTMTSTATARWLRAMLAEYRGRSLVRHHGPFCPSPPASARSGAVSRARVLHLAAEQVNAAAHDGPLQRGVQWPRRAPGTT